MKRNLLFGAAFLLITVSVTSCTSLSDCQFCKTISTDSRDGSVNIGTTETQYCDAELAAIKIKSVTVGSVTTTYQCR